MDEKIEITEKAVRQSAGQEKAFVNMLNEEMEMLILSLGYRKESDTAREICDLILEHWEKKQFVECDWLRVAIAEKYGVDLGE